MSESDSEEDVRRRGGEALACGQRFKVHLRTTVRETSHAKLNYCLGCISCFVVVVVVAVVNSLLAQAPVVFLRLAETQKGERDFVILDENRAYNYTRVAETLAEVPAGTDADTILTYSYSSPRSVGPITAFTVAMCNSTMAGLYERTGYLHYDDVAWECASGTDSCWEFECLSRAAGQIAIIDIEREAAMGCGRSNVLEPLEPGQMYIKEDLASTLNVGEGDVVFVFVDLGAIETELYLSIVERAGSNFDPTPLVAIAVPLTVKGVVSSFVGRFRLDEGNLVVVDYKGFIEQLVNAVSPAVSSEYVDVLRSTNLYDYVSEIAVNLPPSRIEPYIKSDFDTIKNEVVTFGAAVAYRVGFDGIASDLPVLDSVADSQIFLLFLGLILNVIIWVLTALAVILIYSLLMINNEARTFELGVLRMVGSSKQAIVELMMVQAFSYAIPGYIAGMLFAQLLFYIVVSYFEVVTQIVIPPGLSSNGIVWATVTGLFIPVVSSIFPIRLALNRSLLESLDTRRSKTKAVEINLSRSEDGAVSWSALIVGAALAVFGFIIYYLFPLALLSFNLGLLINIFFGLILGLLIGLTVLSLNFQFLFERFVQTVFLRWWEAPAVYTVVEKNLIAHRVRNRKTALLYAISLSIIIFILVTFNLQISSLLYNVQVEKGAYVTGDLFFFNNMKALEEGLEQLPSVNGWTYSTLPLDFLRPAVVTSKNVGRFSSRDSMPSGVAPTFFTETLNQFLIVGDMEAGFHPLNLSELVYSASGSHSMIFPTSFRKDLGVWNRNTHVVNEFFFPVEGEILGTYSYKRFKPLAFVNAAAFYSYSKFPGGGYDTLVSIPTMVRLLQGSISSVEQMGLGRVFVNVAADAPDSDYDRVVAFLGSLGIVTDDYRSDVASVDTAARTITVIFSFTTIVAMVMSFFSLVSSMYSNIRQQTKEIAILRALGIKRSWMRRIYVHEAFVLVFSSSLMGIIIGTLVSWTMILQQVLFTQLPIVFVFPWEAVLIVLAFSMISAVASSFFPINNLIRKAIIEILRI